MSNTNDDSPADVSDPKYDNWPIADSSEEEYEWIGTSVSEAHGGGAPHLYQPRNEAVYMGEVDEENEQIIVREENRRDIGEDETLGDVIKDIGDSVGWSSLSSFAEDHLSASGDDADVEAGDLPLTSFQERNVHADADHQRGYFGSYTYRSDDGRIRVVEHEFHVYTDDDRRQNGKPVARVLTEHLEVEDEEMRREDAQQLSESEDEFVVDAAVDRSASAEEETAEIEAALEDWHVSHARSVADDE